MEPLTSHETTSNLSPHLPTVKRPRNPVSLAVILIAFALIAATSWTLQQWNGRVIQTSSQARDPQWSIDAPAADRNRAFVRVQDTSFWAPRAYGLLTSNSHVATQAAAVELKNPSTGARIVVAPFSVVRLTRTKIEVLNGMARAMGPLNVALASGPRVVSNKEAVLFSPAGETAALEPRVGHVHDLQTSGFVNFSWPKTLASTSANLEFSRDADFKTILFTHNASGPANTRVDFSDRAPGPWFARLREGDRDVAMTAFNLVESQTPDSLRRLGRRWLSWRDRGVSSAYRVEFSSDETFQQIAHGFQVRNREFDLSQVAAGSYFARVVALTVAGGEYSSRPVALQVQDKAEILRAGLGLNDPDLKLFARGWKILLTHDETSRIREGYVILRESELRGVKVSPELTRTLANNNGVLTRDIVFELSRDDSFANPERVRPDAQGELLPPALPLGILFARLRRVEADGQLGAFGPASRLTTWLPAPLISKPRPTVVQGINGVELNWDLGTTVTGYELRVSPTADFDPVTTHTIRTRSNSRKIASPSLQRFYWTVTAINEYGQPVSMTSDVQEVLDVVPKVEKKLKPVARTDSSKRVPAMSIPTTPQLQSPLEDAVLVGAATAVKYGKLMWTAPINTGSTFEVQIATDGDFVNVIEKGKTKKTEFTLQGDLPEGALFWRVRKAKSDEWSTSRRFELVYE